MRHLNLVIPLYWKYPDTILIQMRNRTIVCYQIDPLHEEFGFLEACADM